MINRLAIIGICLIITISFIAEIDAVERDQISDHKKRCFAACSGNQDCIDDCAAAANSAYKNNGQDNNNNNNIGKGVGQGPTRPKKGFSRHHVG